MMIRSKICLWLALSLTLALLLGGCSQASETATVDTNTPADDTAADEVVEIEAPAETDTEDELSGEIVISLESSDVQTYQALADAYMALHPNVKVLVELKAASGDSAYLQFVRTQFAAGTPRVSILESVHFRDLAQEGLLLNWAPRLQEINPYTGEKWEDSFQDWALNLVRDPNTGEMFTMPYMSVQTFWVYNKNIFAEAGITDVPQQPTWDQLVEWSEKIKAAGYIPIAMEGTIDQIWSGGRMPWLLRSASDQYRRDDLNLIRCQEGDWCYRDGIDDTWSYDPTDPRNDDPDRISINIVRHLNALKDGDIRFDTACTVDMVEQIGRVFKTSNGFVPDGWAGMNDAYPLFLTQKSAMWMVHGGFFTSFPKDIRALAEGEYGGNAEVTDEDSAAAKLFDYGTFSFPSLEGDCVQGKARANELTSGSLAIPKKDRAQNDLEVDFIMFWTSPQGMKIYLENKLDPTNLQGGIAGPPLINGVELPGEYANLFENTNFIGNYEKPGAPGDAVARGFFKYEPTVREWATMMQLYFNDEMTAQEFADSYQQLLEDNFDDILAFLNLTPEDLESPEKRPPGWVASGPY